MKRRDFITFVCGAAVTWPVVARAEQPAIPLIGFLSSRAFNDSRHLVDAFRAGLQTNGYIEGQNVAVEYRWAEGHYDRLPALAAELVRSRVAVLVTTGGEPSVLAAKAATSSIPIVFTTGGDPVKMGLVASLSRPGGNATGISLLTTAPEAKRLGILHELAPRAAVVGVLIDPNYQQAEDQARELREAAKALNLQIEIALAGKDQEFRISVRNPRPKPRNRAAHYRRSILRHQTRSHYSAGRTIQIAGHLPVSRLCGCGRVGELWCKPCRWISPGRHLCWPNPQR